MAERETLTAMHKQRHGVAEARRHKQCSCGRMPQAASHENAACFRWQQMCLQEPGMTVAP
jgi:hypothetical protein